MNCPDCGVGVLLNFDGVFHCFHCKAKFTLQRASDIGKSHAWVAAAPACMICRHCGIEQGDDGTNAPCPSENGSDEV